MRVNGKVLLPLAAVLPTQTSRHYHKNKLNYTLAVCSPAGASAQRASADCARRPSAAVANSCACPSRAVPGPTSSAAMASPAARIISIRLSANACRCAADSSGEAGCRILLSGSSSTGTGPAWQMVVCGWGGGAFSLTTSHRYQMWRQFGPSRPGPPLLASARSPSSMLSSRQATWRCTK